MAEPLNFRRLYYDNPRNSVTTTTVIQLASAAALTVVAAAAVVPPVVPPPDPLPPTAEISGSFPIPNGVSRVVITGLALPSVPMRVFVSVRKGAAVDLTVFASVITETMSVDGFESELSGLTDSDNYTLDYKIIL